MIATFLRRVPVKRRRSGPARKGRVHDRKYLAWLHEQQCVICVALQHGHASRANFDCWKTEAAHVGDRGLGQKCSDRDAIPLCATHHRTGTDSHHVLGKGFWEAHGLDRDMVIAELNEQYQRLHGGVTVTYPPGINLEF